MQLSETKFAFLTSVRFWKLVIIGILEALMVVGVIGDETLQSITRIIELVLGSSVFIRTADRFGEKAGASDTGN